MQLRKNSCDKYDRILNIVIKLGFKPFNQKWIISITFSASVLYQRLLLLSFRRIDFIL